jgi:hypothetical protein
VDPSINIAHQSDPVTVDDPILGERTFLVITDELAGAAGNAACPGGGLHVYDITGSLETNPVKVGVWNMPEVRPAVDNLSCTAHVLRLYPEQGLMTIAWYDAGSDWSTSRRWRGSRSAPTRAPGTSERG